VIPSHANDARVAARATAVAFVSSGFAFASWASRIPAVRDRLDLSPSSLGLVLFVVAVGAIVALVVIGAVIARIGSHRTSTAMAVALAVGLLWVALGYGEGVAAVSPGLFLLGFGAGGWDVAMNVQAAAVEQRLDRPVMSRFHAGYSFGTVCGALVGAAATALGVSVTVHLALVAVGVMAAATVVARGFLDDRGAARDSGPPVRLRAAWRERRTLLIGVFVLGFAFAEGTANDWISVAAIDGHGTSAALGVVTYALFLAAMTAGRWFGPGMLIRYGRVTLVRGIAVLGTAGVLVFVFSPWLPLAVAGALLWGFGTSLGFPVGMSAAADEPQHAAARVSVVSSIGYCAFLGGPPLIGVLGDSLTVLRALTAVAVLLGISALVANETAPPPPPSRPEPRRTAGASKTPST
jgi:MFS family permease